jgi:aspartyl-tRNA(Asn)/glutamyl-tRNA(Gln) amidotransferase subunit B
MTNIFEKYESVIGIEVHVQLNTTNKIFCACENRTDLMPNSNICIICCGYPGTLPVLNKEVVDSAIMVGLATNCNINNKNWFARKHYFYADLPKGYQITQSDVPICENGYLEIKDEAGHLKKIRIKRIHMEEDAGKNIHTEKYGSLVDYNRAGTPLLEIVTHPDISSAYEAREYLKELHSIVVSLGITTGNMEEGAFRADTNISVRKKGDKILGTRCELKNINSFKFIHDAAIYEIERQINIIENGEKVIQQTRLWDTKLKQTYAMRTKEDAEDYRYFQDPDLAEVLIDEKWINDIKTTMPELPKNKKIRFINEYNLSEYEAEVILADASACWYFENTYKEIKSKLVASWIMRELMSTAKEFKIELKEHLFTTHFFAKLLKMIEDKKITQKIAQEIFINCFLKGIDPEIYADKNNLIIAMLDEGSVEKIIIKILNDNQNLVAEFKAGKIKVKGFLVGKIMAETKGNADPEIINKKLDKLLN